MEAGAFAKSSLEARGVGTTVRTAAITYDSSSIRPSDLRRFALNRDLRLDEKIDSVFRVQGGIDPLRARFFALESISSKVL